MTSLPYHLLRLLGGVALLAGLLVLVAGFGLIATDLAEALIAYIRARAAP